jgi:translation elongation factor EF-1alpha
MNLLVGRVTHYFSRLGVAVLELTGELKAGDTIMIQGHTTDVTQHVESMEIEHHKIQAAGPGIEVALQVLEPVRSGDKVYKVFEE